MVALNRKEIFAVLNKLGIHSTPELTIYFKEYKEYCINSSPAFSTKMVEKKQKAAMYKFISGQHGFD